MTMIQPKSIHHDLEGTEGIYTSPRLMPTPATTREASQLCTHTGASPLVPSGMELRRGRQGKQEKPFPATHILDASGLQGKRQDRDGGA